MSLKRDYYVPDLAASLARKEKVFSWVEALQSLHRPHDGSNASILTSVQSSPAFREVLLSNVPSFPAPSQKTKTAFETTTAAGLVDSQEASYNVSEIKSDAVWLSGEVQIAEDEALRIVALEWQQRSKLQLLAGLSDAEQASMKAAFGNQDLHDEDTFVYYPNRQDELFDTEPERRTRIAKFFLQERTALLAVVRELQQLSITQHISSRTEHSLQTLVKDYEESISQEPGLIKILDSIDTQLQKAEAGKQWSVSSDALDAAWFISQWEDIRLLLEILLLRLRSPTVGETSTNIILQWLRIVARCRFFSDIVSFDSASHTSIQRLQGAASIVTLAILDPAPAVASLSGSSTLTTPNAYFLDTEAVLEITGILFSAAEAGVSQAAPVTLVWAMILNHLRRAALDAKDSRESQHVQKAIEQPPMNDAPTNRRTSYGSLQQSLYEDILDQINTTSMLSDPIGYLLRCSVEVNNAFDVLGSLADASSDQMPLLSAVKLQVLQEAVTVSISGSGYSPEVLNAQFAVLAAQKTAQGNDSVPDIRETFIKNDFLMDSIFTVAAGRFPYESLPFLRLCRLLSSARIFDEAGTQYISFRLQQMDHYTQIAAGQFSLFHTVREDENLNLVALGSNISVVEPFYNVITASDDTAHSFIISANTIGEVISESNPPIIRWQHQYSGLSLTGKWLELHYLGRLSSILSVHESADDVAKEIIGLFVSLLSSTFNVVKDRMTCTERERLQNVLLAEASADIHNDLDISDCIFEIMEQEIQAFRRKPTSTFDTSLLTTCVQYLTVLLEVKSEQSWNFIHKSSLVDSYGTNSLLFSIVETVEVTSQNFAFLEECVALYSKMTSSALSLSRGPTTDSSTGQSRRYVSPQMQKFQSSLLLSVTQSLWAVFRSIPSWRFTSIAQMYTIIQSLSRTFANIAFNSHGVGTESSIFCPLFQASCTYLDTQIRSTSANDSSPSTLLQLLLRIDELDSVGETIKLEPENSPVKTLLFCLQTFVRLGKLQSADHSLESQLLDMTPLLVRLASASLPALSPINKIMADSLSRLESHQPTSLLGHLGSTSSLCFIQVLKHAQRNTDDLSQKISIWQLLATLVGKHQQWMALVILTGSRPEKKNERPGDRSELAKHDSFMDSAIDLLIKIHDLPPQLTITLLEFVLKAQQNWSWTAAILKLKTEFLPTLMNYVTHTFIDKSSPLRASQHNKITSLIIDLATTHLHYVKAIQDKDMVKTIMALVFYFAENDYVVSVSGFNSSLHANLRRNFAAKFPGLQVTDFKRNQLRTSHYGEDYYYDVDFMELYLQQDRQWNTIQNNREQSFAAEFRRANLNLSVVDSELALLHSIENFCIEHCGYFVQNNTSPGILKVKDLYTPQVLYTALTSIVRSCLQANTHMYPGHGVFEKLLQSRNNLVIALLQKLVDVGAKGFDSKGLIAVAWNCARFRNDSYEQAITNDDLIYWRSSLTIILLTLQFHCGGKWFPVARNHEASDLLRQELTNITPTVLEILSVVVGNGFRTVVGAIQDQEASKVNQTNDSTVSSKDVSLILSLLNTILRLTRAPEYVSDASSRLISSGLVEACLLLYSWSHTMTRAEFGEDPVYADLCLQYLVSLSSIPQIAELMGVEAILSRLLSGRVSQNLQRIPDGAGPLDKRPHCQFLYGVWADGILPLCLNLLYSVGPPIAAEVSVFLNQYPNQLKRASTAFVAVAQAKSDTGSLVTLNMAQEAAVLSMISYVLESYRKAGASVAIDPTLVVPLSEYDELKKSLSDDISDVIAAGLQSRTVATNSKEMMWAKKQGSGNSQLERKILHDLKDALVCLKGRGVADEDEDG